MTLSPPRRATIMDVAEHAGVAISSASAALNDRPGVSDDTRARVRQAAASLKYVPSLRGRSLSSKRAFSIGLIVERDFSVLEADPFFSAFIGGVEESLSRQDYALLLQIVNNEASNLDRHLEHADSRRVDGLILNELRTNDLRVDAFRAREFPVVGVNPGVRFPFPAVSQDNRDAIHALIETLVSMGHQRIAHVSGPPAYVHSAQRRQSWQQGMSAFGLEANLIVEGDFTHKGGTRAAESLLSLAEPPTAVFCANDLMAIGFMNRAVELGYRVPKDISVAGFDGIALGTYVRPTLTTVATTPHLLGQEAARLLLGAIADEPSIRTNIDPARLVVRKSTAPAPR